MLKKYVIIIIGCVIALSAALIGYGFYLNISSDNNIARMMEQRANAIEVEIVKRRVIAPEYEYDTINLYSEKITDAVAQVQGVIKEVYVRSGAQVKKGEPLCRLVNDDLPLQLSQVQSKIATARSNHIKAVNDLQRRSKLLEVGAVSQAEYDNYVAAEKSAQTEIEVLEAELAQLQLRQENQLVTAPVDGDVLITYVSVGDYVAQGKSLVLIGDFNELYLKNSFTREELLALRLQDADHYLHFSGSDFIDKGFKSAYKAEGTEKQDKFAVNLVQVQPSLDVEAPFYSVIWHVDNAAGMLEPGVYNHVKLVDGTYYDVLGVPVEALVNVSEVQKGVYIVDENNYLRLRYVTIGASDERYAEVLKGLEQGERVVVSGKEGLYEGNKVEVFKRDTRR